MKVLNKSDLYKLPILKCIVLKSVSVIASVIVSSQAVICKADENLDKLKPNVIENCNEAKNLLSLIDADTKSELISYLAKVASFRIEDDLSSNQQMPSMLPSIKSDSVKSDQSLNIFQRDEKMRALDPEKESMARRCALEMMELTAPDSFHAINDLFEIYEKAPVVPNDPEFLKFLHQKTNSIIAKSIIDQRFFFDEKMIVELINYYFSIKSPDIRYAILGILQERRSIAINYLIEKILQKQEIGLLNLLNNVASSNELKVILSIFINNFQILQIDLEFRKELIKNYIVICDRSYFETFNLSEDLKSDELFKNRIAEKFYNRFIYTDKIETPKISNDLLEVLFKFSAKENNYVSLLSYFNNNKESRTYIEDEAVEVFKNSQLTVRKEAFFKFISSLNIIPQNLNNYFSKLIFDEDCKSKLFATNLLLSIKAFEVDEDKNVSGFKVLEELVIKHAVVVNQNEKQTKKNKKLSSLSKATPLISFMQSLFNETDNILDMVTEENEEASFEIKNQRMVLITKIIESLDVESSFEIFLNVKTTKQLMPLFINPLHLRKLSKASIQKLVALINNEKSDTTFREEIRSKIAQSLDMQCLECFDFANQLNFFKALTSNLKSAYKKYSRNKTFNEVEIKEITLDKSGIFSCNIKLAIIMSNMSLLKDQKVEETYYSCLTSNMKALDLKIKPKNSEKLTVNLLLNKNVIDKLKNGEAHNLVENLKYLSESSIIELNLNSQELNNLFKKFVELKDKYLINSFISMFQNALAEDSEYKQQQLLFIENEEIELSTRLKVCFNYQNDSSDKTVCKNLALTANEGNITSNDFMELLKKFDSDTLNEIVASDLKLFSDIDKISLMDQLLDHSIVINKESLLPLIYSDNVQLAERAVMLLLVNKTSVEQKKAIQFFLLTEGYEFLCREGGLKNLFLLYGKEESTKLEFEARISTSLRATKLLVAEQCLSYQN